MTEHEPFATVDDLETRWHTLLETERKQAGELLADASDKIRQRVPHVNDLQWVETHSRTLKRVCCSMVKRAMQQLSSGTPEGVTQSSESTGPFANSYTWSNPDGNIYLTKEELRDLGVRSRIFSLSYANRNEK